MIKGIKVGVKKIKYTICFFGSIGMILFLSTVKYVHAESKEHDFYEMFDNHGSSMLLIDPSTGEVVYANQSAADFYGYSINQLTRMNIADINTLSADDISSEMQSAIKEKRNYFEFKHKLASGEIRNVEVYSYPYNTGTKEMLFSIIHDVTVRVKLEEMNKKITILLFIGIGIVLTITLIFLVILFGKNKRLIMITKRLSNTNGLLTKFINADDRLIYLKDENFRYLFVNEAFEKFYELPSSDIVGRDDYVFSEDNFATLRRQTDETVVKNNDKNITEVNWNGRIYKTNKFPVKLLNDNYGVGAFIEDITEEKKHASILEKANNEIIQRKNELQILLDSTAEGIYGVDLKGICTFINQSGTRLLGYESQDDIVGENIHNMIHKHTFEGKISSIEDCDILRSIAKGKGIHVDDGIFWRKDNTYITVEYNAYPQCINGEIIGAVVTFTDNSLKKKMERLLYAEKELFKTTLLSVGDAVISTDNYGNVKIMNLVAEKMTGWKQSEAFDQPFEAVFNIISEFTGEQCENPVLKVLDTGETSELENHTVLISKDGTKIPIEDSAAPIKDEDGNVKGVVIVFRDCSEGKEKIKKIEYLSFHDHLTGLYNRRYLEDSLHRLDTERNLPFAVLSIDINGLKLTNDAFGHKMGDKLICRVAELLKEICREDDIIGRMGGDEFIILLPKTNILEVDKIKKRIVETASKIIIDSTIVSLSVGYAVKDVVGKDMKEILTLADNDMYKDKIKYGKLMRSQTIETVLKNINLKYDKEQIHTERVSEFCEHIARALKMDENHIQEIKTAGILHDIGKIVISPELLNKTGKLTKEEFTIIKRHPETSYQKLKSVDEYAAFAEAVLYHHERYDGKGYPEGLIGDQIPLYARIITVADAYEAMTAIRTYQKTKTKEEAIAELIHGAGSQFDPEIVDVFVNNVL